MKISQISTNVNYALSPHVIFRKNTDGLLAINLDNLKEYNFTGASADVFNMICEKKPSSKILSELIQKSKSDETQVEKELERLIEFLLSKDLIHAS